MPCDVTVNGKDVGRTSDSPCEHAVLSSDLLRPGPNLNPYLGPALVLEGTTAVEADTAFVLTEWLHRIIWVNVIMTLYYRGCCDPTPEGRECSPEDLHVVKLMPYHILRTHLDYSPLYSRPALGIRGVARGREISPR